MKISLSTTQKKILVTIGVFIIYMIMCSIVFQLFRGNVKDSLATIILSSIILSIFTCLNALKKIK